MSAIKGLFLDLDGTLVDTLEANIHAYIEACKSINRKVTAQMLTDVYGQRVDVFLKKFFPDIKDVDIELVKKHKAALYPKYLHLARPHKTLIDFVDMLHNNHTITLVTTAQRVNALAVLESIGITDLFDYVVTGDDVISPKPHPEAYLLALKLSGIKKSEALAFEDSPSGIKSAQSAGIATLRIEMPKAK